MGLRRKLIASSEMVSGTSIGLGFATAMGGIFEFDSEHVTGGSIVIAGIALMAGGLALDHIVDHEQPTLQSISPDAPRNNNFTVN